MAIVLAAAVGLSVALAKAMLERSGEPEQLSDSLIAPAKALPTAAATDASGPGMAAIAGAAGANKYLFLFFWKEDDGPTAAMKAVFQKAMKTAVDRAQWAVVRITDPAEKAIVDKFDLQRAPMPLVLALAPNGAVMGGFPAKFAERDLLEAFGSPCSEKCMRALQENKLVLLCVQNGATKSNEEAMRGVRDFKDDPRFGQATELMMLDPADTAESPFLADLKISPGEREAVTAFLVPPGSVVAEFKGATNKEELIAALQKANTGCGPGGCGPSGCGPKK
jgi:hypothetical protein